MLFDKYKKQISPVYGVEIKITQMYTFGKLYKFALLTVAIVILYLIDSSPILSHSSCKGSASAFTPSWLQQSSA